MRSFRTLSLAALLLLTLMRFDAFESGASAQSEQASEPSKILNPEAELKRLIPYLRERGGELVDKVYLRRNLSVTGIVTHRFDLNDERCIVLVGIASNGADLNLSLLSPSGRMVATDMRADSHPNVRLCHNERGAYTARFQMNSGSGDVYFALFHIPSSYRAELSDELWKNDGSAPRAPARAVTIDRSTQQRVMAMSRELGGEGFAPIGAPQGVSFSANQTRDFRLNLKSDRCYVFASVAGRGVLDTHASILGPDEVELISDPDRRRDSTVRLCPIEGHPLILRVRLLKGEGAIFIAGWQTAPPEDPPASAARTPPTSAEESGVKDAAEDASARRIAPPKRSPATPSNAQDDGSGRSIIGENPSEGVGLDERFATHRADLLARGYTGGEPISGGTLKEGARREYDFTVSGGRCYAALVSGSQSVARLSVAARDASGGILDRDLEGSQSAIVRFCAAKDEHIRLDVVIARGGGELMLGLFVWPRGVRGPFGLEGVLYVRLAEMIQLLELEGYEPSLSLDSSIRSLEREGQRARHPITLEGGSCYALVAVGDEYINHLELALFDGEELLIADYSRSAFPSIRHCPDETRELSFEVGARRGRGKYFYQLFIRKP